MDFDDNRPSGPGLWRQLFSLRALGTSVFLIIGLLSLLFGYLQLKEPKAAVTFELISATNVLDLRRPLQDLSIVFRNEDIQQLGNNLRILTINVANTGEVDILQGQYDREDDWGMKFNSGEVIEARIIDTSSEYLGLKMIPKVLESDTVGFPKVILEKGESFTLEVLLLHPRDLTPSIHPIGKIAGINRITVSTRSVDNQEDSLFERVLRGSPLVQVIRATLYFLGSLFALTAVILGLVGITDIYTKLRGWRRRKQVLSTNTIRQMEDSDQKRHLVRYYESTGYRGLEEFANLIKDPAALKFVSPPSRWVIQGQHELNDWDSSTALIEMDFNELGSRHALTTLLRIGALKEGEDDGAAIDQDFADTVENLVTELKG